MTFLGQWPYNIIFELYKDMAFWDMESNTNILYLKINDQNTVVGSSK